MSSIGRLVISCPDRAGIVATVSEFLYQQGANITHSDQHSTDPTGGEFFMRVEFTLVNLESRLSVLEQAFAPIAERFGMECRWVDAARRKRITIFASKEDHCLMELLYQVRAGDIHGEVARVIGNHADMAATVVPFGVEFCHVPITAATKPEAEARQMELSEGSDFIVLARYMQVLSAEFCARWEGRVINIHHSFLPAFAGAKPYNQAHERGVKLIGATAHFVTSELDQGPIIEQDVQRVGHGCDIPELRRRGRQIERVVLARAVKWHVEDRVLVHGNRTVVFA